MKNKYQQYRKRIFAIILLLQVAFIFSDEGELHYMEEPEIINATHFDVDGSPLLEGIFDSNECLMAKAEAKSILEKDYGVKVTPDEKQRFILGKCNPVLFVNGIFASRLAISVNCKTSSWTLECSVERLSAKMKTTKMMNKFYSLLC